MSPRINIRKSSPLSFLSSRSNSNPNLVSLEKNWMMTTHCWWKKSRWILVRKVYPYGACRLLLRGNVERECRAEGGQESFASSLRFLASNNATRLVSLCLPNLTIRSVWRNGRRKSFFLFLLLVEEFSND